MERCKTLINKLQEQSDNNADPSAMMITVQMLQAELSKLIAGQPVAKGSTSVSVVMPVFRPVMQSVSETPPLKEISHDASSLPIELTLPEEQAAEEPTPVEQAPVAEALQEELLAVEPEVIKISEEQVENIPEDIIFPVEAVSDEREIWVLNPVLETPTLAHQDEIKELNEMMGKLSGESLNDRLKTARSDISSFLTDTPVRDLKKAIGINDRFLFVSELFRGDVDMYERSIKTINNFRILAEAEYWIERELKIKLGWDINSEAARQFNQLIKRRFS